MTGTAATEADEFMDIYRLDVVEIPTNVPVGRKDEDDEVYRTAREKYEAIIDTIKEARARKPAGAGRHHLDREIGSAGRHAEGQERSAQRAECPLSRAGSRRSSRRPASPAPSPSPPTWPAAAPTSSSAAISTCASPPNWPTSPTAPSADAAIEAIKAEVEAQQAEGARRPAASSSSAPSATRAGASTTSCAAAPAARAIPAARCSISRSKTT